jgi:hypothetical protein
LNPLDATLILRSTPPGCNERIQLIEPFHDSIEPFHDLRMLPRAVDLNLVAKVVEPFERRFAGVGRRLFRLFRRT